MKILEKILSVAITPIFLLLLSAVTSNIGEFDWWYIISAIAIIVATNSVMLFVCPQTIPKANNCWLVLSGLVVCIAAEEICCEYKGIFELMTGFMLAFTVFSVCLPDIIKGIQQKFDKTKN